MARDGSINDALQGRVRQQGHPDHLKAESQIVGFLSGVISIHWSACRRLSNFIRMQVHILRQLLKNIYVYIHTRLMIRLAKYM